MEDGTVIKPLSKDIEKECKCGERATHMFIKLGGKKIPVCTKQDCLFPLISNSGKDKAQLH